MSQRSMSGGGVDVRKTAKPMGGVQCREGRPECAALKLGCWEPPPKPRTDLQLGSSMRKKRKFRLRIELMASHWVFQRA